MRNYHKFKAIQEIAKRNVNVMLSDLQRKTKCKAEYCFINAVDNKTELESLHNEFVSVLSGDSVHNHAVNIHQFAKLFSKHVEWWPLQTEEQKEKIFGWFD